MSLTPANFRLVKIAALGGFFVSVTGYYMKWQIDQKLRSSDYYLKAVRHLMAHRPLVEFMGEPIKFRNAHLSDNTRNYTVGETEAVFEIPMSGSLKSGVMHFRALRTPDEFSTTARPPSLDHPVPVPLSWKVVRLEVTIDGRPGERVVVPIRPLATEPSSSSKPNSELVNTETKSIQKLAEGQPYKTSPKFK